MLDRLARRPWWQLSLVVLVAACVYLPFLGVRPLDLSEGHRAVPGWTMLESGNFWHQTMFGLTYIRKPPGIAWAIAASSAWLRETPFAARLPSAIAAILMSGIAWWYGRRWFGAAGARLAGVSAGLAQALLPLMWSPGRTAEIEMLNNFGTQLFALGLIDLLAARGAAAARKPAEHDEGGNPLSLLGDLGASVRDVMIPAIGLLIAALAKGPASAPVLGGVLIGACVAVRSVRPLANRGFWVAMVFGMGAIAVLLLKFQIANDRPDAVREDVAGQFLWSKERIWGVVTLLPLAFASAMPMSLAVIAPFFGKTAPEGEVPTIGVQTGRTLAWSWLVSVSIMLLAGVYNARYAMPAAVLIPPLVPCAFGVLRTRLAGMDPARRTRSPERWLLAGRPVVWAGVMAVGAWWFIALTSLSPSPDQKAGVAASKLLGGLARNAELWADDAIEARPDVLWMMQQESPGLKVRWAKPRMLAGELPQPGDYVLLRTDGESAEGRRYEPVARTTKLIRLGEAEIRKYRFTLYQVRAFSWPLPP